MNTCDGRDLVRAAKSIDDCPCWFHVLICSQYRYVNQALSVANLTTDNKNPLRYRPRMSSQWVKEVLEEKRLGQAELARRIQDRFKKPFDRSIINKLVLGKRVLSAEEMFEISEVTGHPIPPRGFHPDWKVALEAAVKKAMGAGVPPGVISGLVTEIAVSGTLGNVQQIAELNSEFRTYLETIAEEVAAQSGRAGVDGIENTQRSDPEQSPAEVKGSQS